jgi:hypothetical protein
VERANIRPLFSDLPATLAAAGLDSRYAAAAYDERWDAAIRKSMADVYGIIGDGVSTPVTVLWLDGPIGFRGPLLSPAPTGADALRLWDSLVKLASVPGVFEISRPRPPRPQMSLAGRSRRLPATPRPKLFLDGR